METKRTTARDFLYYDPDFEGKTSEDIEDWLSEYLTGNVDECHGTCMGPDEEGHPIFEDNNDMRYILTDCLIDRGRIILIEKGA